MGIGLVNADLCINDVEEPHIAVQTAKQSEVDNMISISRDVDIHTRYLMALLLAPPVAVDGRHVESEEDALEHV